jgi:hypothetical protein
MRWQKFVVENSGKLKRKYVSALKLFHKFVDCFTFIKSSGEKFTKMNFGDCSIRMVVRTVCCLLMVSLDSLDTDLSRGCKVCVVGGGRLNISMSFPQL